MKINKFLLAIFISAISFFTFNNLNAQMDDPISWQFEVEEISDNELYLVLTASIDYGWSLYAQDQVSEFEGPLPLYFSFDESDMYELIGEVISLTDISKKFDEVFELDVFYFSSSAVFKQKIKTNTTEGFNITGFIEGMACFDDRCILVPDDILVQIYGGEEIVSLDEDAEPSASTPIIVTENPYDTTAESDSMWQFFLIAVLFGILAILTPCVFPMIPMTITFFMQKSSGRMVSIIKALIFGFSIVILYTLVGLIVSLTSAGADFTTILSTNWIPNLLFFLLFVVFAASLFGLFEMVLPSSLVNKADKQVDKGGLISAFFLALTLVIVSFSCTGPIIGALLVQATTGNWLQPSIGMLGFGLGFALPFTVLAVSPNWMKKLPKSGGWLNSVKVVMGFLILAFSMKFLSNIDQNYHLNLFSRDIYIAIWIVIFSIMGVYLLGKIRFAHDSEVTHIGFFRLMLAIISFTIAVYLFPGMFGANLSTISGLIPPKTDQKFDLTLVGVTYGDTKSELCDQPRYADRLAVPYNIKAYFDYKQGLECAENQDKPLLLYFTGHSCSNCKKMQGEVWSDPRVQEYFNDKFVVTALYVDDRVIEMPEDQWFTSSNDGRLKKRLGEANADIQIVNFNRNTQPYYVTISPDGRVLNTPMAYNNNIEEFLEFLQTSLDNFEEE